MSARSDITEDDAPGEPCPFCSILVAKLETAEKSAEREEGYANEMDIAAHKALKDIGYKYVVGNWGIAALEELPDEARRLHAALSAAEKELRDYKDAASVEAFHGDEARAEIARIEAETVERCAKALAGVVYGRICECGDWEHDHAGGGPCSTCCQSSAPYDGCELFRPAGFEKMTECQIAAALAEPTS